MEITNEAILIKNDHWNYVNGIKLRPTPIVNITTNQNEIYDWVQMNLKTKADIILAMTPSELCHAKHYRTSTEVWQKLEEVYHSKGPTRKAALWKQLLFTKLREDENMMKHLNNFFSTVDRIAEMEIPVAAHLLAILLLYSLPNSYDNFCCVIETRDKLPAQPKPENQIVRGIQFKERKNSSSKPAT